MKKIIASVLGAAVMTGAVATTAFAGVDAPIDPTEVRDGKVAICHFPGHKGPGAGVLEADFVIQGLGGGCDNNDGEILIISCNALKGHKDPADPNGRVGTTYCVE